MRSWCTGVVASICLVAFSTPPATAAENARFKSTPEVKQVIKAMTQYLPNATGHLRYLAVEYYLDPTNAEKAQALQTYLTEYRNELRAYSGYRSANTYQIESTYAVFGATALLGGLLGLASSALFHWLHIQPIADFSANLSLAALAIGVPPYVFGWFATDRSRLEYTPGQNAVLDNDRSNYDFLFYSGTDLLQELKRMIELLKGYAGSLDQSSALREQVLLAAQSLQELIESASPQRFELDRYRERHIKQMIMDLRDLKRQLRPLLVDIMDALNLPKGEVDRVLIDPALMERLRTAQTLLKRQYLHPPARPSQWAAIMDSWEVDSDGESIAGSVSRSTTIDQVRFTSEAMDLTAIQSPIRQWMHRLDRTHPVVQALMNSIVEDQTNQIHFGKLVVERAAIGMLSPSISTVQVDVSFGSNHYSFAWRFRGSPGSYRSDLVDLLNQIENLPAANEMGCNLGFSGRSEQQAPVDQSVSLTQGSGT